MAQKTNFIPIFLILIILLIVGVMLMGFFSAQKLNANEYSSDFFGDVWIVALFTLIGFVVSIAIGYGAYKSMGWKMRG